MSNPKADFYANCLFEVFKHLPQLPVATFSGCDKTALDFSKLDKIAKFDEAYEVYKEIMSYEAMLDDINYTEKILMKVNGFEFYFIVSEQYARIERNINEWASMIFRYFRCYEYVLIEAIEPRDDLIKQYLAAAGNAETEKWSVYGPCVLLPCGILDKLNKKKKK